MLSRIIINPLSPPIAVRDCDWEAFFEEDDLDEEHIIKGYGRTPQHALADLMTRHLRLKDFAALRS